jgi:hypothetical protein
MKEMLDAGEAIDLSNNARNENGDYILNDNQFVDGSDYCDAKKEAWIWSIGQHVKTGQILASTAAYFYQNPNYNCLWLR